MKLDENWKKILNDEISKDYFLNLSKIIDKKYNADEVYPEYNDIFKAFNNVRYSEVKVVILGQDPYHGKGQANGLAFSVDSSIKIPPSLKNIFKELELDLNIIRTNPDLCDWSEQGVMLLNTILTVEKDKPMSHHNIGWEIFTDKVVKTLNDREEFIIFVLWGNNARSKKKFITNSKHFVIESAHPSPLSAYRGFFGSKPFSKINNILSSNGKGIIKW